MKENSYVLDENNGVKEEHELNRDVTHFIISKLTKEQISMLAILNFKEMSLL